MMCVHMYMMCVYMCVSVYIHICLSMYFHHVYDVCICMCVYVYSHMCIYMYACVLLVDFFHLLVDFFFTTGEDDRVLGSRN